MSDYADQLKKESVIPKTDIGQHFLVDPEIVDRLINTADVGKDDIVIEVGAGTGVITEGLLQKAKLVCAYEVDQQFAPHLNQLKNNYSNLRLVWENILQVKLPTRYNKIVGNIPYHISEGLLWMFRQEKFEVMSLIVGKEFAIKLTAKIGEKDFCNLSVIFQARFNIQIIETIGKDHFYPQPPVASALIKVTPLVGKDLLTNLPHFVLNYIWKFNKMKLRNALREALISYVRQNKKQQLTKKQASKIVNLLNLPKEEMDNVVDGGNPVLVAKTLHDYDFGDFEEI